MLWQRSRLIQAGETCSPDEQLTDHLLRSSAYECNVCWGGWILVPAFHSFPAKPNSSLTVDLLPVPSRLVKLGMGTCLPGEAGDT